MITYLTMGSPVCMIRDAYKNINTFKKGLDKYI